MSTYPPDWYTDRDQDRAERHGDPLLHWPEADRVLARERAEALRRVSGPVCMERVRPARDPEGGLDAARGICLGLIGGLLAWGVILAVAYFAGLGL